MKKPYLKPVTEDVHVNLFGSVLGGLGPNETQSDVYNWGLAKEQDDFFETDGSFGDIWGDGDNSSNPYDLWDE